MPGRARLVLLPLLLLASTAACSATPASGSPGGSGQAPTATPVTTASPRTTTPVPTDIVATSTPAVSPSELPSDVPAGAAACTGKDDNKAFFGSVAAQMKWDVYCAVLPAGWFLSYAHYELGAGGQLSATYKGPGGAHLQLLEGNYCTDPTVPCQPKVSELGPTLYGDRTGTLVTLDPGHAVYVGSGENPPSWAAASVDLDESTFVKLVAGLHKVAP
jgi:hypothetical protein